MVALETSKVFGELPAADLEKLRSVTQELSFAPEQVIFKEGDPGNGIYLVKDGQVKVMATAAYGDLRLLSRLGPGDLFGEMAVLDNQPRSATMVAENPTIVYFIGRIELLELIDQRPRLAGALIREISRRLRDFNHQYIREMMESERLSLVGRFASSIVHDLKNPLNIIGISADMSCMPNATEASRQNSKVRIRKQVERITNMVSELLDFARGSQTTFVMARMDYSVFIKQLIEEIQAEVAVKNVKLVYVNEPPALMIQLNPQRLSRVFHNLIGNAADAMSGGGTIKLKFSRDGNDIVTELQDSGAGIAPEIADKLFQAFATYGKSNGTGLGLSICKKIVQDHRGKIYARNAPDGGAIFGFTLPAPKE